MTSPSPTCPFGARERRLRGSPIAGFFRMHDLPHLNTEIRYIKAKWRRNSGVHGIWDCRKKPSGLLERAKIKDGVMGSEDSIKDPRLPIKLNVYFMSQ